MYRILLVIGLFTICSILPADDQASLRKAFRDGVLAASTEVGQLQLSFKQVLTEGKAKVSNKNGSQLGQLAEVIEVTSHCSIRDGSAMKTFTSSRGIETLRAINASYAFQLIKSAKTGMWSIDFIEPVGKDSELDKKLLKRRNQDVGHAIESWYLFGTPLDILVGSPEFKINGAREINRNGTNSLVRIDFDYIVDESKPETPISNGYLICDPSRHWAMTEFGGDIKLGATKMHKMRMNCQIELAPNTGDFPCANQVTITMTGDSMPPDVEYRIVNQLSEIGTAVPEDIFFLSHYGFSEPVFENSWLSTWQKYLLAGMTCVVLAYWIRHRRTATAG